jgi:archaellum component FlaC
LSDVETEFDQQNWRKMEETYQQVENDIATKMLQLNGLAKSQREARETIAAHENAHKRSNKVPFERNAEIEFHKKHTEQLQAAYGR